jgi:hypothetical protein
LLGQVLVRGNLLLAEVVDEGLPPVHVDHHDLLELPKPSGKQPKHQPWWNTEPTMQEGIQLPELLQKIRALREAGLRAEHMAFSFMKRRVQPLMARDTLG